MMELTQLQLTILSNLMEARRKAQSEEMEFTKLLLDSKNIQLPEGTIIKLENGKLTWDTSQVKTQE